MSNETMLTIVGNLSADPELRYAPSGIAAANLTVASTPRYFDRQAGERDASSRGEVVVPRPSLRSVLQVGQGEAGDSCEEVGDSLAPGPGKHSE